MKTPDESDYIEIKPPQPPQVCRDCGRPIRCEACYEKACDEEAAGLKEMLGRVEG